MPTTVARISLTIPEDLLELYDDEAARAQKTTEEVIISRLYRCRHHDAERELYFNDKERNELEVLTGGRILNDAKSALDRIRTALSLRIDNIQVSLKPNLLSRIRSRCSKNMDFPQFVKRQTIEGLERFAQLR